MARRALSYGCRQEYLSLDDPAVLAALDAATYQTWLADQHSLTGYPQGPYSDRGPLAAVLYCDIRRACHTQHVPLYDRLLLEYSLRGFPLDAILQMFPNEPVKDGRKWDLRPTSKPRAREIIKRVRRCVLRTKTIGNITVIVESQGWKAVGQMIFG